MNVIRNDGSHPIKAWVGTRTVEKGEILYTDVNGRMRSADGGKQTIDIEDCALAQLNNLARLPFIHSNGVVAMPGVHAAKGSTTGTVTATDKAIIPASVGDDIGCGIYAVRLTLRADQLPVSLTAICDSIAKAIPLGKDGRHPLLRTASEIINNEKIDLDSIPEAVAEVFGGARYQVVEIAVPQLGTLGSGSHFIELCADETGYVWVLLQSGSHDIGKMIGSHFNEIAKRNMEQFFISLPVPDLAYFPEKTDDFNDYIEAVEWAQSYALENRRVLMKAVIQALHDSCPVAFQSTSETVNCHHNSVVKESHFGCDLWVTRNGAIAARVGDLGITRSSMGMKSYIVRGKGNPEAYGSCSHGTGRTNANVIAEDPDGHMELDLLMENQKDLVEVVHSLKTIVYLNEN